MQMDKLVVWQQDRKLAATECSFLKEDAFYWHS